MEGEILFGGSCHQERRLRKMTLTPITSKSESKEAFLAFQTRARAGARSSVQEVGWPGGHGRFPVHWKAKHGFWTVLHAKLDNRYWIACGTQPPAETRKSLNITCAINPPKTGHNGRYARLLLQDSGRAY